MRWNGWLIWHHSGDAERRSQGQAKVQYLEICMKWHFYGCNFFQVEQQDSTNQVVNPRVYLGINWEGIMVLKHPNKELMAIYPYTDICSWSSSQVLFSIVVGSAEPDGGDDVNVVHPFGTKEVPSQLVVALVIDLYFLRSIDPLCLVMLGCAHLCVIKRALTLVCVCVCVLRGFGLAGQANQRRGAGLHRCVAQGAATGGRRRLAAAVRPHLPDAHTHLPAVSQHTHVTHNRPQCSTVSSLPPGAS